MKKGDKVYIKEGTLIPGTALWVEDEYPTLRGIITGISYMGNYKVVPEGSSYGWYLSPEQIVPIEPDDLKSNTSEQHGHPRFYELLKEFADLHSRKNADYAQGGKPTGNFDRVSTILSLYPGLDLSRPPIIALLFMMKQFDAVMWSLSQGYKTAVESQHDKIRDMAVYSTLAIVLLEEEGKL